MSTFPSILTSYTDPAPTNRLNSPSHSSIESAQNSGISQLEAVIGVSGVSSVVGTYEYIVKSPASDGGGHVQTANKGGTGQISFNKGDILVATSSSVLSKLAVGSDNLVLTADSSVASGIKWGNSAAIPTIRVYGTSSSVITWSKPSTLSYIIVEVQAAGGNGGTAVGTATAGAGGGGGGYTRKLIRASVLGLTENILVGSVGTLSYFGSVCSATQGGYGGNSGSTVIQGGAGGIGTGGDLNIGGGAGGNGISAGYQGGVGGSAHLGGGGAGGSGDDSNGSDGRAYGGGGGGASTNSSGTQSGGIGGPAVVYITEF